MKSGLYAWAGASATARAAAWAKRFDEPITNESNVYFGFSPSTRGGGSGARAFSSPGLCSRPTSSTRRSSPAASRTAASIRPRKWPSIHSRAKSFGTRSVKDSSERSEPWTSENHVRYVDSLSALRSRSETSVHRSSAVSNCWRPTRLRSSSRCGRKEAEHSSVSASAQRLFATGPTGVKVADFQVFSRLPQTPPHLWRSGGGQLYSLGKTRSAQGLSRARTVFHRCGKACDRVALYTAPKPLVRGASITSPPSREAHLTAQHSSAEASARFPRTDVDPGRPGDLEAAQGSRAEAPLRVEARNSIRRAAPPPPVSLA